MCFLIYRTILCFRCILCISLCQNDQIDLLFFWTVSWIHTVKLASCSKTFPKEQNLGQNIFQQNQTKNLHKRKSGWSASSGGGVRHKSCCDQVDWVPGDDEDRMVVMMMMMIWWLRWRSWWFTMMTVTSLLRVRLELREGEEEGGDKMATMLGTGRLQWSSSSSSSLSLLSRSSLWERKR